LGLECDYIAGHEHWIEKLTAMAPWDFLIGSVHYLPQGWEVDQPKYVGRHAGASEEIWTDYWKEFERCIRSGLFDFVAHPDLPKKFGFRPPGDLRRFYEPSIAALADTGIPFEINTAVYAKNVESSTPRASFSILRVKRTCLFSSTPMRTSRPNSPRGSGKRSRWQGTQGSQRPSASSNVNELSSR
jgi:histidinol-phosphatase (PHP family)